MRDENSIRLSASQIDSANSCLRKWWLNKVAKCPQPFDRKKLLGEVGHEVCERYLQDKFLYPKDWTSPTNRWDGTKGDHHLTTTEQALVKALITKAIKDGVLIRQPDGEVELDFEPKAVAEIEGVKVDLLGFIDYYYGNNVDDHKFTGAPKYYGKAALKKAIAMNLYAWSQYESGKITDPTVWLRYNLFVKDTAKPAIKMIQVERTKEEIYKYYEEKIEPSFKPMVLARKNCDSWEQVDSAMDRGEAATTCKKYGGCEYMDICLGKSTVDEYKARFDEADLDSKKKSQKSILDTLTNKAEPNNKKPQGAKENKMGGFLEALKNGDTPEPVVVAKEEPKPKAEPKAEPKPKAKAEAIPSAPWAFPTCPVCSRLKEGTRGLKGTEPCKICVMNTHELKNAGEDQAVVTDFDVAISDEGVVTWELKGEVIAEAPVVEQEPVVKEVVESKAGDEFGEQKPDDKREPEPVLAPNPEKEESGFDTSREGFNSEKTGTKGFIVSYAPVRSCAKKSRKLGEGNCVVHIAELTEMVAGKILVLANSNGAAAKEFLDIDYFVRRDLIAQNAKAIAEMIGNSVVDASSLVEASMEQIVVCAIERYASFVYGSMK